jgi:hypothetical protein
MLPLKRWFGLQPRELGLELADVVELPVDRSEADVGDAVELLQAPEGKLTNPLGLRRSTLGAQLGDDPIDEQVELLSLERSLDRRSLETGDQLAPVKGLAGAVSLSDVERPLVVALVGREPPLASGAATPAAHGVLRLREPGVDHTGIGLAAEGTTHTRIILDVVVSRY